MSPAALLGRRSRALRIVLAIVFLSLAARLITVQELSHGQYATLARAELTQTVTVPAVRGGIFDRNGEILAESVQRPTVVADPYLIKDPNAEAAALSPVLGIPADQLRSELTEASGFVYLAHRVSDAVAANVTGLQLEGINIVDESQRVSPDGDLALPVLGRVGTDGNGLSGLEYQYQSLLAGTAGTRQVTTAGGVTLSTSSTTKPAQAGTGIELTVDEAVQYVAEHALGAEIVASHAQGGTAVVMDVHTGDILAMADLDAADAAGAAGAAGATGSAAATTASDVSAPTNGPVLVPPTADALPAGVVQAPSNSALTQVYEPGSVFKLVTFSAALQDGVIGPSQSFSVPDSLPIGTYTFHDAESHPTESLSATDILAQSSNIGTIEVASALGKDRLLGQIANLGFGKPTGLDFPGESQGLVPPSNAWTGSSIGSTPIGQDDAVTAQQVLDAYNAVADGGVWVQPRLVRATIGADGTPHALPIVRGGQVIAPTTNAELVSMLESVVQGGTGTEAAIDGYTVAGKTGTAQIPDPNHLGYIPGAFMGSFAGFAPAQNPVLSCIVVLQHPTPIYGGAVAAPVFSTIMQYALHHYGIPTTAAATPGTSAGAIGGTGSITVAAGVTTEGP